MKLTLRTPVCTAGHGASRVRVVVWVTVCVTVRYCVVVTVVVRSAEVVVALGVVRMREL